MCRDRLRLAFRALQRGHISDRTVVCVRRDVGVGYLELAHGIPPDISASAWHTEPAFSSLTGDAAAAAAATPKHGAEIARFFPHGAGDGIMS